MSSNSEQVVISYAVQTVDNVEKRVYQFTVNTT